MASTTATAVFSALAQPQANKESVWQRASPITCTLRASGRPSTMNRRCVFRSWPMMSKVPRVAGESTPLCFLVDWPCSDVGEPSDDLRASPAGDDHRIGGDGAAPLCGDAGD